MPFDEYHELLARKSVRFRPAGIEPCPLNPSMFPHQTHGTEFALRAGRSALFYDTGLGKSLMALEWGRQVADETGKPVLMLAPLAVAPQHKREADRFGIPARIVASQDEIGPGVNLTNYEKLDRFAPDLGGVILDESSILKSFTGKTYRALLDFAATIPFRLCCTATPAPNDHMELGQHAQFLGIMNSNEMLSRWFVNDTSQASQKWRLKGHAVADFWDWVASWARAVSKPSDIGFDDAGFDLPPLNLHRHQVEADLTEDAGDMLFRIPEMSATSVHREKRLSLADRVVDVARIVAAEPDEPWIVWCETNDEADALIKAIPDAIEVRGSHAPAVKEDRLVAFSDGRERVLITKPTIAGFGLNWQHCARVAFVGLSFSYEQFYQAVRRCWRFGQNRSVDVHVVVSSNERAIWDAITRKADDHSIMKTEMTAAMRRAVKSYRATDDYNPQQKGELPSWL